MKRFSIYFFILISLLIQKLDAQIPTDGLVAYYPFNGNANDESVNGNNGEVNGATLTIDRFGNANCAYSFDGIEDFIKIFSQQIKNNQNSGEASYALWYYPENSGCLYHWGTSSLYTDSNGVYHQPAQYEPAIWADRVALSGGQRSGEITQYSPISGWNFIAASFSESKDEIIIYFNGEIIKNTTVTQIKTNSNGPERIFNSDCDWGLLGSNRNYDAPEAKNYYKGKIDDMRIYDRALNDSEMDELFHENGWREGEEDKSIVLYDNKLIDDNDIYEYEDFVKESIKDVSLRLELRPESNNENYGTELRAVFSINGDTDTKLSSGELLFAIPEEINIRGTDQKLFIISDQYSYEYKPNECASGIISSLGNVVLSATTTFVKAAEPLAIFLDIFSMGSAFSECTSENEAYDQSGFQDKNKYKFVAKPYSVIGDDPIWGGVDFNKFEFSIYFDNSIDEVIGFLETKKMDAVLIQNLTHNIPGLVSEYTSSLFFEKNIKINTTQTPSIVDFITYQDGNELFLEWHNPEDESYSEINITLNGNQYATIDGSEEKYTISNLDQGYYEVGLTGVKKGLPSQMNSQIVTFFDEYDGSILGTNILRSNDYVNFSFNDWGVTFFDYDNLFKDLMDFQIKVLPFEHPEKSLIELEIICKNVGSEEYALIGEGSYMVSLPKEIETIDQEIKVFLTDNQHTWEYKYNGCLSSWWDILFEKIPGVGLLTSISSLIESIDDCTESNSISGSEFEDIHNHRTFVGSWGYDHPHVSSIQLLKIQIPINMNYVKAASILAEHKMAVNYDFSGTYINPDIYQAPVGFSPELTISGLQPQLNEQAIAYVSRIVNSSGTYEFNSEPTAITLDIDELNGDGEISVKRVASISNSFIETHNANPLPQTWDINVESSIQNIKTDLIFSINDLGIENFEENSTSISLYKKTEKDSVYKFYSNVDYNNNGTAGDMSDDYLLVEGITSFSKFILAGEGILTNIDNDQGNDVLPTTFSLYQNYPNPFNPTTTIAYSLPKQVFVNLKLYDILGREIKTLINELKKSGTYRIEINGADLSSGIYFYKLQAGDFVEAKKMILLK